MLHGIVDRYGQAGELGVIAKLFLEWLVRTRPILLFILALFPMLGRLGCNENTPCLLERCTT